MDDYQNENNDLLEFINNKCMTKKDNNIDSLKVYYLFTKSIKNALLKTYQQQSNYYDSISCVDLIYNIFWIIFNYSLNPKLTMFMCDRAVLLFNEYINISKTYGSMDTNMIDVKQFIINKTIGPLKLNKENKIQHNHIHVQKLSQINRNFVYKIFNNIISDTEFYYDNETFFTSIFSILSNILYKFSRLGHYEFIEKELNKIIKVDILDIPREINLLKIKLEINYYLIEYHKKNLKESKTISEKILNEEMDMIDEHTNLNDFFDCDERILDKDYFIILIQQLNNRYL